MVTSVRHAAIHPVHAILLASALPLFLGALLSDWSYAATAQIQWVNFAAWLIAGGLVFAGFALLWAVIDFFRADVARSPRRALYLLALASLFVLGLINALVHGKDAWAAMPLGLILSIVVFALAAVANWLGFSTLRGEHIR